jgi:Protein kinase domain/PEGA domain
VGPRWGRCFPRRESAGFVRFRIFRRWASRSKSPRHSTTSTIFATTSGARWISCTSNVVVSYDGHAKLIDFGIAKAATKVYETRVGVIKGTYGYISPEALTGNAPVDRRADVFALGILLYEMLVGQHPFDNSDEPNLLSRIVEARYKRPREVRREIPAALDRLIARCLVAHPEGRPSSVREFIVELTAHMSERGLVPTQVDLAALACDLVPDEDGPVPVRRPTASRPPPVFPSSSIELPAPLDTQPLFPLEEDPTKLELFAPPPRRSVPPSAPMPRAFEERRTADLAPSPEQPGDMPALSEGASLGCDSGELQTQETRIHASRMIEPPPREGARRFPKIALAIGGAAVMVALCYAREVHRAAPATALRAPTARQSAQTPSARRLLVTSEPSDARVSVDGRSAPGTTPLTLEIAENRPRVVITVEADGFVPEARVVSSSSREARFVLVPNPPQATQPSTGSAPRASHGRQRGRRR